MFIYYIYDDHGCITVRVRRRVFLRQCDWWGQQVKRAPSWLLWFHESWNHKRHGVQTVRTPSLCNM